MKEGSCRSDDNIKRCLSHFMIQFFAGINTGNREPGCILKMEFYIIGYLSAIIKQCYGFIKGNDGKEVFIHKNEIPFWTIYLKSGDTIEYIPKKTMKGIQATQVKILEKQT